MIYETSSRSPNTGTGLDHIATLTHNPTPASAVEPCPDKQKSTPPSTAVSFGQGFSRNSPKPGPGKTRADPTTTPGLASATLFLHGKHLISPLKNSELAACSKR